MTYREILEYQERSMNFTLVHAWVGFIREREAFRFQLALLRQIIRETH